MSSATTQATNSRKSIQELMLAGEPILLCIPWLYFGNIYKDELFALRSVLRPFRPPEDKDIMKKLSQRLHESYLAWLAKRNSRLAKLPTELREKIYSCLGLRRKIHDLVLADETSRMRTGSNKVKVKCRHQFGSGLAETHVYLYPADPNDTRLSDLSSADTVAICALSRTSHLFHDEIKFLLYQHAVLSFRMPVIDLVNDASFFNMLTHDVPLHKFKTLILSFDDNRTKRSYVAHAIIHIMNYLLPMMPELNTLCIVLPSQTPKYILNSKLKRRTCEHKWHQFAVVWARGFQKLEKLERFIIGGSDSGFHEISDAQGAPQEERIVELLDRVVKRWLVQGEAISGGLVREDNALLL